MLFEKEAPDPIVPSRLDDQDRLELIVPSCVSIAVPENVTEVPLVELAPFAGEVIVTTGGELPDTSMELKAASVFILPYP